MFKTDEEICKSVRNETFHILKSINNCDTESAENKIIQEGVREIKQFISENPEILITKADKGNTVIMNRENYWEKIYEILNYDHTTYKVIQ